MLSNSFYRALLQYAEEFGISPQSLATQALRAFAQDLRRPTDLKPSIQRLLTKARREAAKQWWDELRKTAEGREEIKRRARNGAMARWAEKQ